MAIFVLFFCCVAAVYATEIDNGVVGTPNVLCTEESILVSFETEKDFTGRVFVKTQSETNGCFYNGYEQLNRLNKEPEIKLQLQGSPCGVQRQRVQDGLQFSVTVVISFHEIFITKVDRAYNIQCHYASRNTTVSNKIEVSELSTILFTQPSIQPVCRYEIVNRDPKYGRRGDPIRVAVIGQKVTHRLICEISGTSTRFCMHVHSCTVRKSQQQQPIELINERGCTRDQFLLQTPVRVSDLHYTIDTHVFKFPDQTDHRFSCSISLTAPDRQGCREPNCAGGTGTVRVRRERRKDYRVEPASTLDLSRGLTVLDLEADTDDAEQQKDLEELRNIIKYQIHPQSLVDIGRVKTGSPTGSSQQRCLTPISYIILLVAASLFVVMLCGALGAVFFRLNDAKWMG